MKYQKKPVIIDAVQYTEGNLSPLTEMLQEQNIHNQAIAHDTENNPYISTLEGNMTISPGDYLIRGVKGEYYPCKPDIFEASYDIVND